MNAKNIHDTDGQLVDPRRETNAQTLDHPITDLARRYKTVFQAAWTHRLELAGPRRLADEMSFLPAALSLQDTPIHPAPRRLAWALMLLFLIALLWSIFGEVDIVAVAPGRIIVSDRTKVIQPLEASVVRRILVKDGDRVQEGQVLVELDPTLATADKANVEEQLANAISEEQRTTALLDALSAGKPPRIKNQQFDSSIFAQLQAEWLDINAKLGKLDAEAVRKSAEAETVKQAIAKLEATVPMAKTRESDFKKLVEEGYISSHATQDRTRERVELERDLSTQRARLIESVSALKETEQTKAAYRAETARLLGERNAQAVTKRIQLTAEHSKANQKERLTQLRAPVMGMVQQLAIHTAGGVVTPAQPLMIVVPDSAQVTAEVSIANQDIGFITPGQLAEMKLETFPFTKYGTISAKLDHISADAVVDEKRGAYYPALLITNQSTIQIDGRQLKITPGMNITAEIKTGRRSVIEYLWNPLQKTTQESLRER